MTSSQIDRTEALAETVKSVWRAVMPAEPFDLDMTWEDAGVDSLKGMEIVLRIEREIGAAVPFDLMVSDMTLGQFLRLLAEQGAGALPADPVFLIPGVYGDGPGLADLRAVLADRAPIAVLPLPDIDTPASALGRLAETAAGVVAELTARQPSGEVRLIGYSYGAYVAQEAARQLEAAGRRVGFLCLIDGGVRPKQMEAGPGFETAAPSLERRFDLVLHRLLCRLGAFEIARRRVLAIDRPDDWHWREMGRRILLTRIRGLSMLRRPRPCAAPTLLVMSDDFNRARTLPLWRAACPDLEAVSIAGGHVSMLHRPGLHDLAALIVDGLDRAARRKPEAA
jgi:phthiocerol/phenolphthiocerol synthesis type-I polyketide synthase E